MKLIDPSYEILEQEPGIEGMFKQIERAGRTCYKSEDKITADSAREFVQRMIDSKHTAMLEHGTCYLYWKHDYGEDGQSGVDMGDLFDVYFNFMLNDYTVHKTNFDTHESFVTTNFRVVVDLLGDDWEKFLERHMVDYDDRFERRVTVKMTTSLHVYKDLTRHRKASFAIESTRFCNYSKDKFGNELTFIKPVWIKDYAIYFLPFSKGGKGDYSIIHLKDKNITDEENAVIHRFIEHLADVEREYVFYTTHGWQAQQAAEVLPQCVKADVIMTATVSEWDYIFDLRARGTTGAPHPEVKRIIEPIMHDFIERSWIKDK